MLKIVFRLIHPDPLSQGPQCASERAVRRTGVTFGFAAMASFCLVLVGCTVTNAVQSPATSSSQTSGPAAPHFAQVTNFGASITCGYYANQEGASGNVYSVRGYAGRLDSFLAVPATQNLCRSGDMAADTVRTWIMPNAQPALEQKQLYTVMVGTNDVTVCGGQAGCLPNYIHAMTAALAWLALPSTDKVLGSSLTLPSPWTPDLNVGVATSTAGASLSFSVQQAVDGRTLYIAYRVFDLGKVNGGTATVQVDGKTVATLSTIVNTGQAIATKNGLSDTIWAVGLPLGAAGKHTVTITNGASGGFFSFQWAGVSSGQYASTSGAPRVMVALLPQTTSASLNAVAVVHNNALNELATALETDGMWVTTVHCESVLNIAGDMADTLHPNDTGHSKLATAFENAL